MMSWMIPVVVALAAPILLNERGRLAYAVLLFCGFGGLIAYAIQDDMSRPGLQGSPGDGLGVAILILSFLILVAGLLMSVMIHAIRAKLRSRRRRRRRTTPGGVPS
ncbi:hypothetical protein ACFPME_16285 [Rhodanobacter umsongensis]|uniref:Uncharacterized protein n=1 Tax=Rhodanobacter umsongensis TaxID=633153 RepID=A0ABW0JQT2_9GAMM